MRLGKRQRVYLISVSIVVGIFLAILPFAEERIHGYVPGLHELAGDYLWLPGGLIASVAYPQGVHTGTGAPFYFVWVAVFNFAIYSAVVYALGFGVSRFGRNHR